MLVRSTHQLTLTEAGQRYYERARDMVIQASEAEIAARSDELGLEIGFAFVHQRFAASTSRPN